jgi:hypothetical protein
MVKLQCEDDKGKVEDGWFVPGGLTKYLDDDYSVRAGLRSYVTICETCGRDDLPPRNYFVHTPTKQGNKAEPTRPVWWMLALVFLVLAMATNLFSDSTMSLFAIWMHGARSFGPNFVACSSCSRMQTSLFGGLASERPKMLRVRGCCGCLSGCPPRLLLPRVHGVTTNTAASWPCHAWKRNSQSCDQRFTLACGCLRRWRGSLNGLPVILV